MNNSYSFHPAPNDWTQIEINMCGRRAAWSPRSCSRLGTAADILSAHSSNLANPSDFFSGDRHQNEQANSLKCTVADRILAKAAIVQQEPVLYLVYTFTLWSSSSVGCINKDARNSFTFLEGGGYPDKNIMQNAEFVEVIIIIIYRPFSMLCTGWTFSPISSSSNSFSPMPRKSLVFLRL